MTARRLLAAAGVGHLVGTLPSARVAARLATGGSVDLADVGTGNPGAANVTSELGARWGAGVAVADIAKGWLAASVGRRLAGSAGADIAATAAVAGHCYPVWSLGRGGGKGVATSVGQCLGTFPAYVPVDLAVAAAGSLAPWWRRRAFAATVVSGAAWTVAATAAWRGMVPTGRRVPPTVALPLATVSTNAMIVARFRSGAP